MLNLQGCTGTERLNPPTKFKMFECDDFIGPSDSIRKADHRATSRSCKKPYVNNNTNENDSDSTNTEKQLSLLPANDVLAEAVSQVPLPMDGWEPSHIFKLFVVLVKPPPDLDLEGIEVLPRYLTQLLVEIGSLVKNGTRDLICHCWWALLSKRFTPNLSQL
jgi:hypothetical protein